MRSIWTGVISFGLVSVPVKLYSATEQRSIAFHQVHQEDGGRIRYRRVCEVCGEEIPYAQISKGYPLGDGETVVLTDDDFADLPLSTSRSIDVLEFVPIEQVDPMYFDKSYYLEPDRQGTRAYVLLREALQESEKVAIVKIAMRQRESLATLRVRDGVFVLETMLWPDEIRAGDFDFLQEDVEVRGQELQMATSLIDTMSGDFEPGQYRDEYREALQAVIDAKVEGREVTTPEGPEERTPAVDLMSALQESVEAAREERAGKRSDGGRSTGQGGTGRGSGGKSPSGKGPSRTGTGGGRSDGRRRSGRSSSGEGSSRERSGSRRSV